MQVFFLVEYCRQTGVIYSNVVGYIYIYISHSIRSAVNVLRYEFTVCQSGKSNCQPVFIRIRDMFW